MSVAAAVEYLALAMPFATWRLAAIAVCAVVGVVAWGILGRRLVGTTLIAPWCWAGGSLACLCATEAWLCFQPAAIWHGHLRYAAAATSFWPLMALLGAKRPQDRGWQFVVLSLWGILLLPSGEGLLYAPRTPFELAPAWSVFVYGLLGLGVINSVPTGRWPVALATNVGRLLLLAPSLPGARLWTEGHPATCAIGGTGLFACSLLLDAVLRSRHAAAQPLDRVWLDFRDAYGLLWGLRVAERFNASARQLNWGRQLRWRGFADDPHTPAVAPSAQTAAETAALVRQNFEVLLRRFVSSEWIESRMDNRPR